MTFLSQTKKVLLSTAIAAGLGLAAVPAALAGEANTTLNNFLAEPASFVAVKNGMSGSVEFASLVNDTLSVQFNMPTHAGTTLGSYVGYVNADGQFIGRGVLTDADGKAKVMEMTLDFQDDGTIIADIDGITQVAGFIPQEMFYGY